MWKWISRVIITLVVLLLAVRVADRLARRASPLPIVPHPNGYDTLLAVADDVTPPESDLADLAPDTIRQLAQTNREALERLHAALRTETGVPLRIDHGWVEKHAEDVKKLKKLAA
jgi:hypothetical protein